MAAHQAPLSLGFSRQEHWSGLPFPSPMHESEKWKWSCSVVSNSSWPHGLQPTRLLHSWDFPGKSTGVDCHCLLRYIYRMEDYSVTKRNEIRLFVDIWIDLESIIQSEVTQKEKNKYHVLMHICGIWKEWYRWTYSQGGNRDPYIEKGHVGRGRGKMMVGLTVRLRLPYVHYRIDG